MDVCVDKPYDFRSRASRRVWGSMSEVRGQGGLVGLGTLGHGGTEVGPAGLAMGLWMLSVLWRWMWWVPQRNSGGPFRRWLVTDVDECGALFVGRVASACKEDVMWKGWRLVVSATVCSPLEFPVFSTHSPLRHAFSILYLLIPVMVRCSLSCCLFVG